METKNEILKKIQYLENEINEYIKNGWMTIELMDDYETELYNLERLL